MDVAIAICEDLWQDGGPVAVTRQAGAGLLVVPNASPYERGKDSARLELCVNRAAEAGATLAYVNMMGGQDELVFDGDSMIVTAGGELLARGPQFERGARGRRPGPACRRPRRAARGHARRRLRRHPDDDPPGGAAAPARPAPARLPQASRAKAP